MATQLIAKSLRELDALVAEHVMGWRWWIALTHGGTANRQRSILLPAGQDDWAVDLIAPRVYEGDMSEIPNRFSDWDRWVPKYTTWGGIEVVIQNRGEKYHWLMKTPFSPGGTFWAGLTPHDCSGFNGVPDFYQSADSLPVAVCLAALASVGCPVKLEEVAGNPDN